MDGAERDYGVVVAIVDDDVEVDGPATERLRRERLTPRE